MTAPSNSSSRNAPLRSARWFDGDDDVAVEHRAALRSANPEFRPGGSQPVIGIADTSSELNPCNLPLRGLIPDVAQGIHDAGGIPVTLPAMSLGEDLMKPTAMLYRNLLSIEIEEYLRAYPLDGIVLLANCDKTVPGSVMGAVSANFPTMMLIGGPRPIQTFRGRRIGSGTALWRAFDQHRSGELDDAAWAEFEQCLSCGQGACNTMGTAASMAVVVETLGFTLPGTATMPADDPARRAVAHETGRRAVAAVRENVRPRDLITGISLRNAIRALNACGGSTNAILHLIAIARRAGNALSPADVAAAGRGVPVLLDIEPHGQGLVPDFHAAGGVPALLATLGDFIDRSALAGNGEPWSRVLRNAPAVNETTVIRPLDAPLRSDGAFAFLHGNLAPRGAVLKTVAASERLFQHRGPAVVFHGYDDLWSRIDDPDLEVTPESVLVLAGCGPIGGPGMPEWGMIPIPKKLAKGGVRDMVRVSDARMSGTSFGTCVLHVAPEAAIGGPLALVRDGDIIHLDVTRGRLDVEISEAELRRRAAGWVPPPNPYRRGWIALYRAHVTQADEGCDLDFLQPRTPQDIEFVEPTIGRS